MKYLLFVIDDGNNLANEAELESIDAFNDGLVSAGYFIAAAGIQTGTGATTIDNRLGVEIVREGSIQLGPENYTGFWIIEVPDHAIALQLAKDASKACNRKVELRPYLR